MEDELEDSAHPLDKLLKRSKKERSASPAITVSGSAEVNGRPTPGTKPKPSKKRKKLKTPADGSIIKRKDATSKSKGSRLRAIEPLSGVTVPAEDGAEQSAADSAVKENADLGAAEKKKLAAKRLPLGAVLVPSDVDRNLEVTRLLKPTRYFDEDFEANAMKCYHCGGTGHLARTCRNEPRQRPCHICAQSHDRAMRVPPTLSATGAVKWDTWRGSVPTRKGAEASRYACAVGGQTVLQLGMMWPGLMEDAVTSTAYQI
eukprot:jgi/Botrbrau1/19640/Bobra.0003s0010.1